MVLVILCDKCDARWLCLTSWPRQFPGIYVQGLIQNVLILLLTLHCYTTHCNYIGMKDPSVMDVIFLLSICMISFLYFVYLRYGFV